MSNASRQYYSIGTSSQMDIRLLGVFMTVVECGGLTQAQPVLNIALSSISTYLHDLEVRLGLKLCNRGRAGFSLTEDGRAVYQQALRLYSAIDTFNSNVAGLRGRLEGELKIGILDNSTMSPSTRIPEVIHRFSEQHPGVHIVMKVLSSQEIEDLLMDGQLHLGIGLFTPNKPHLRELLRFEVVVDLYCGHQSALFNKKQIRSSDIKKIGYAEGCYSPSPRHPIRAVLPQATASSYLSEGLAFLILSGRYIGYLPRRYSANWVSNGEMRALPEKKFSHRVEMSLVVSRHEEPASLAQSFVDHFLAFS